MSAKNPVGDNEKATPVVAEGSGGPRGKRNGNFRHGGWTYESVNLREAMRAKVREIRGLLRAIGPGAK
jgi:hypothetical protein